MLYVRRPGNDYDEVHDFGDDDPFLNEFSSFVDTVESGGQDTSKILSSYDGWSYRLSERLRVH